MKLALRGDIDAVLLVLFMTPVDEGERGVLR